MYLFELDKWGVKDHNDDHNEIIKEKQNENGRRAALWLFDLVYQIEK